MKTIAYSSPYVPAEWIEAHGLQSRRLRPLATDGSRLHATTRGVCPYAAVLVANAVSQDAIILTTVCDQMRYAASLLTLQNRVPVFLLNVPSTWQTSAARQLYRAELQRLGRFLTTLGGTAPTDSELTSKMLAHVPHHNCEAGQANRCHDESSVAAGCHRPVHTGNENQQDNVPVAVVGGPLLAGDDRFWDLIEQAGGRVAIDATEDSPRTSPRPFAPPRSVSEPFDELADAYFDGIVDPFQRPNNRFYDWFGRQLAAKSVQGIILRRYLWCDLWHAELQRMREWSKLPVLEIDIGLDDTASPNRMQGRIEAFFETLKAQR